MATPASSALQKTFPLDSEILGPNSSLGLELDGSTDADVLKAIATNQPFPTRPAGVIDLTHISLVASGGNPVAFKGGDTTVGFAFSAGVTAGLGVFDDPQAAIQALGLGETPGLDLTIGAAPNSRYTLLRAGYQASGSVSGTHPIGVLGSFTFGASAAADGVGAVLHRFDVGAGADTVLQDTILSWRFPRHVTSADKLKPGTWIVAEADGSLSVTLGASLGYNFNFIKEVQAFGLSGDIGLKIDAAAAGDASNAPATAQQSFSIGPAAQSISFTSTAPTNASYQGATYAVSATASSGLPVSFTVDSSAVSVCSVSGSTISFIGVGTCTIDADQSGNADFQPAPQVKQSFGVAKATPTITWAKPSPIRYGTALSSKQLDASASVPGTFSFIPGSGSVLGPGPQTLSVAFKPIDTTDYSGASASVTIYVSTAPVITSRASVDFPEASSGTFTVTATGAPTPVIAGIGHLPSGVTFVDHRNGTATLSGTPTAGTKGTYTITIEASNGVKPAALQSFTLTVSGLQILTTALPTGTRGHHYSVQLQASGGVLPLKWTEVSLPAGLTLSTAGLLSGTPSASLPAGSQRVLVKVQDSTPGVPQSTTKTLTLSLT